MSFVELDECFGLLSSWNTTFWPKILVSWRAALFSTICRCCSNFKSPMTVSQNYCWISNKTLLHPYPFRLFYLFCLNSSGSFIVIHPCRPAWTFYCSNAYCPLTNCINFNSDFCVSFLSTSLVGYHFNRYCG